MAPDDAVDACPDCGGTGDYVGDAPTNTGPTAVDPGYVAVFECRSCGRRFAE